MELENINDVARILQVKYQRKEHTEDKGRGVVRVTLTDIAKVHFCKVR